MAVKVLEQVIERGLDWYDYEKLDKAHQQIYFSDANQIINNSTFNNELNHYMADLIKECATMEGTPLGTDKLIKLTNIQFGIVVLETLKERLGSIKDPKENLSQDFDPNEPI